MATAYSIIVATKDRARDLTTLLQSMKKTGILKRSDTEVIIVDNNPSSDRTRHVCERFGVRYVLEPIAGKSRALNTGIRLSHGKYLAFTDDDVTIDDPRWLDKLRAPFRQSSRIGYVSGNVVAKEQRNSIQRLWERKGGLSKGLLRKHFSRAFLREYTHIPWPLTKICAGANCMIPRALMMRVGGYSHLFGPGGVIGHGESLLIGYEIMRRGYEAVYLPDATVLHKHPTSAAALKQKMYLYGTGDTGIHAHIFATYGDRRSLLWAFGGHQWYVVKNLMKSIFGAYPLPPSYVLRSLAGSCVGPYLYFYKRRITPGPL